MMKTHQILTAAAILGLSALVLSNPASAQVSGKGGPIAQGSDQFHAEQSTHTEYFDGRVELQQDDARLRADHIKIIHGGSKDPNSKSWGDVTSMEATGNIYYVTTDKIVKGDNAVYTKSPDSKGNDVMVITGDVILEQGQNVMTGNRLTYDMGSGVTTLDANPTATGKGRVKGVFYPDDKTTPATAAPAATH